MIKNISKNPITLRWNSMEKILKPGQKVDVRDFNVPQNEVAGVEGKIGSKFHGQVVVEKSKSEELAGKDMRKQQEDLVKGQEELAKGQEDLAKEREAFEKEKKAFEAEKKKAGK